ncbi:hypothetical protein [Massilia sp. erpn]|uniref:hypothetical protein n=1 Tax=Massilia sp. erpn TaxID=2738142 RepID=UPI0021077A83|nr:hypothetical protein [Massilia sp. erpn]UTY55761.1 hypothetical protein HPQ68_00320 [Massilia sp. erpn]
MKDLNLAGLLLRARLRVQRAPMVCLASVLLLAAALAWAWLLPQRDKQQALLARPLPAPAALVTAPPPPSANENLAEFYATLGEKRHAEQQVGTLFALAAKSGLSLHQGEYKFNYDKASRVASYQILLPVKGGYQPIWQFVLRALAAVPFASLDEVSFRRENIADLQVEAKLRFTLYLKEGQQ